MYRVILKNLSLVVLFFVIGDNSIFSQIIPASFIKPSVTLAAKDSGNINLSDLKKVTGIEVNAPYKIVQFTIVINDNKEGKKSLTFYTLTSKEFTKEVIDDLVSRGANVAIILDEIKVKDEKGNILKVHPNVFHVVGNN